MLIDAFKVIVKRKNRFHLYWEKTKIARVNKNLDFFFFFTEIDSIELGMPP